MDLVTAMTAARWFDCQRFLKESNRILMPGGCLALLGYTMDMELEYGDISDKLNDICKEVRPKMFGNRGLNYGMTQHGETIQKYVCDSCFSFFFISFTPL